MTGIKNIVICSDGTGNTAIKGRGTNVFKMFEAVDIYGHWTDRTLTPQIAFYDDGVGTERMKVLKAIGGAFGWGLSRNVKELYAHIARTYNPGDRIFLFGFSRGAFTVRTLAGFIATCGIVDRGPCLTDAELRDKVAKAYSEYRRKYRTFFGSRLRQPYEAEKAEEFRKSHAVSHEEHAPEGKVEIEFIGVWDTVDAVGLPFDKLADWINDYVYPFKFTDLRLSPVVKKACHAIAIDDERHTFHPVMWDETGEAGDRIEQVWFPGVHSNVGGGYPKQGMSLVALYWMMMKANEAKLRFVDCDWELIRDHQNCSDKLYDSRAGLAIYYRYKPRDIGDICSRNHIAGPKIHMSIIERIAQGTEGYAPGNIPAGGEIVATEAPPQTLGNIAGEIRAELGRDASPLDRVRPWVSIRQYSHYLFIIFSLVAVYFALQEEIGQVGFLGTIRELGSRDGILKLGKSILFRPHLPLVIVFFYALGLVARKRIESVFSRFWHDLRPKVRDNLFKGIPAVPVVSVALREEQMPGTEASIPMWRQGHEGTLATDE